MTERRAIKPGDRVQWWIGIARFYGVVDKVHEVRIGSGDLQMSFNEIRITSDLGVPWTLREENVELVDGDVVQ